MHLSLATTSLHINRQLSIIIITTMIHCIMQHTELLQYAKRLCLDLILHTEKMRSEK